MRCSSCCSIQAPTSASYRGSGNDIHGQILPAERQADLLSEPWSTGLHCSTLLCHAASQLLFIAGTHLDSHHRAGHQQQRRCLLAVDKCDVLHGCCTAALLQPSRRCTRHGPSLDGRLLPSGPEGHYHGESSPLTGPDSGTCSSASHHLRFARRHIMHFSLPVAAAVAGVVGVAGVAVLATRLQVYSSNPAVGALPL